MLMTDVSLPFQIENAKQGVDQKLRDGQEKLHQMWLEWSQKQPSQSKEMGSVQPEVGHERVTPVYK